MSRNVKGRRWKKIEAICVGPPAFSRPGVGNYSQAPLLAHMLRPPFTFALRYASRPFDGTLGTNEWVEGRMPRR